MSKINFEQDQVDSVTQIDSSKKLSDKVIDLKNLEDEIENAERSVSKLKETARQLSGVENKASDYANLARGRGYEPIQKIGVHAQTLKAVFRDIAENKKVMPEEYFKTFVGNQTKITRRK